ncbi:MAG: AAA family ATPase, partial [Arcobacteraceae bacterium]
TLNNAELLNKLISTFNLLGYLPSIHMKFDYNVKSLISRQIGKGMINQRIRTLIKKSKYINNKLSEISDDDKNNIISYVQNIKKFRKEDSANKIFSEFTVNFNEVGDIIDEYRIVRLMVLLELLKPATIELEKKDTSLNSESLSSGEKNLLFITLNILANVRSNSLIVIDEPEISLHPNWQIKYSYHLKKILLGFTNLHVVIATHSHFIASGLKWNESNIFTINNNRIIEKVEDDIYGWSAENILYRIFSTRTVNNYFIEMDLKNVFKLISSDRNGRNLNEIKKSYENLEKITTHKDDPLNTLIQKIKLYIDEN